MSIVDIVEKIKKISKKLNLKNIEEEYRYYIVVRNKKVEMMLIKSNKNIVSRLGYFYKEDDCKKVINKYHKELLNIIC